VGFGFAGGVLNTAGHGILKRKNARPVREKRVPEWLKRRKNVV